MGIPIMVILLQSPHTWVGLHPLYTQQNNQGPFFHCSNVVQQKIFWFSTLSGCCGNMRILYTAKPFLSQQKQSQKDGWDRLGSTLPETNSSHQKIGLPTRELILQPPFFRCELLVFGDVSPQPECNRHKWRFSSWDSRAQTRFMPSSWDSWIPGWRVDQRDITLKCSKDSGSSSDPWDETV